MGIQKFTLLFGNQVVHLEILLLILILDFKMAARNKMVAENQNGRVNLFSFTADCWTASIRSVVSSVEQLIMINIVF